MSRPGEPTTARDDEHGGLAYLDNLAAYSTNPTLLRAVAEVRAEIVESRPPAPPAVADNAGEDEWATADTVCECGHDRGGHDGIGNCWHMDAAGAEDCSCDQFRRPAVSPGGQAYELREALVEVLAPRLAIGGTAAGRLADALLSGPLVPLLADRQAVIRRILNTVDPAQSGYDVRSQCVAILRALGGGEEA